jgi:hypothetical protein
MNFRAELHEFPINLGDFRGSLRRLSAPSFEIASRKRLDATSEIAEVSQ